jgi:hypothetical protein
MGLSEEDRAFIKETVRALLQSLVPPLLDPLKEEVASIGVAVAGLVEKLKGLEAQVAGLQDQQVMVTKANEDLEARVGKLEDDLKELRRQRDSDANRSMRKNLIFYGVNKVKDNESWSDCEEAVKKVVRDVMGRDAPQELGIERAHRLTGHGATPVPIVALFSSWKVKEAILARRRAFKESGRDVTNQYTPALRTAFRHLIPFVEEARNQGKKAKMAFDRAMIDGTAFVFDHAAGMVRKEADAYPRRRPAGTAGPSLTVGEKPRKRFPTASPDGARESPRRKPRSDRGGGGASRGRGGFRGQRDIGNYFSPARNSQDVPQLDGESCDGRGCGYDPRDQRPERGYGYPSYC